MNYNWHLLSLAKIFGGEIWQIYKENKSDHANLGYGLF